MEDFTDIGIDNIEIGVELFNATKINQSDLTDATIVNKIKTIADFLKDHPDPVFIIQSVSRSNSNPDRSNLEHLYSFVGLQNQKKETQETLDKLNNELKHYG